MATSKNKSYLLNGYIYEIRYVETSFMPEYRIYCKYAGEGKFRFERLGDEGYETIAEANSFILEDSQALL